MPQTAPSKPARQRRPFASDDQRRATWKEFVADVFARRRRPATREIAARINELLGAAGTDEELSQPTINHWLSKPGKTALRVPSTGRLANALVAALDKIGIWNGVLASEAEAEKTGLVELLGFKIADVTAPATGLLPAKDRLERTLVEFVAHLHKNPAISGLMQVHSAIGYHSAWRPAVAEIVFKAVRGGMHCCYVLHQGWNEFPARDVLSELRRTLKKVATEQHEAGGWQNKFWAVEFPANPILPLTTLFARVGVLSSFPAAPGFSAANGLEILFAAGDVNIASYWGELSPDLSRREAVEEQVWRFSSEQSTNAAPQYIQRFLRQMHLSLEATAEVVTVAPLFPETTQLK